MADRSPNEPAALLYTSGTTGAPKGATLTVGNIVANVRMTVEVMGYAPNDKVATFLPLFHVFAQNTMMNAAFESGATVILFRRFEAGTILRTIEQERATLLFAVASIYVALLATRLEDYDLSSLRFEVAGAAPLPNELVHRWQARLGRPINQGYGLTETSPLTNCERAPSTAHRQRRQVHPGRGGPHRRRGRQRGSQSAHGARSASAVPV